MPWMQGRRIYKPGWRKGGSGKLPGGYNACGKSWSVGIGYKGKEGKVESSTRTKGKKSLVSSSLVLLMFKWHFCKACHSLLTWSSFLDSHFILISISIPITLYYMILWVAMTSIHFVFLTHSVACTYVLWIHWLYKIGWLNRSGNF